MVEPMTPEGFREYLFEVPEDPPQFARTDLVINGCRQGKDYSHVPRTMDTGLGFASVAADLRAAHEESQQAESGDDQARPDRNGKKPRAPKLPDINRQQWWNR